MQQARRFNTTLSLSDAARQHRQQSSNAPVPSKAHTIVILDQTPAANATTYRLPYNLRDRDAVTAEELLPLGVVFASFIDTDSGDLTVAHFVQHNSWQERDDDEPGLYENEFDRPENMPNHTSRPVCERGTHCLVKDSGEEVRVAVPLQPSYRWHHHVRERHPDRDD